MSLERQSVETNKIFGEALGFRLGWGAGRNWWAIAAFKVRPAACHEWRGCLRQRIIRRRKKPRRFSA